jgi:hypothetical protein
LLAIQEYLYKKHAQEKEIFFKAVLLSYGKDLIWYLEEYAQSFGIKDEVSFESLDVDVKAVLLQAMTLQHEAHLYGLAVANWQPKDGFQALVDAIREYGPCYVKGFIGEKYYHTDALTPTLIEGITVYGFKSNKRVDEGNAFCHSVVAIGASSDKVFFIDPDDESKPDEPIKIYYVSYQTFVNRLANLDNQHVKGNGNNWLNDDVKPKFLVYNPTFFSTVQFAGVASQSVDDDPRVKLTIPCTLF